MMIQNTYDFYWEPRENERRMMEGRVEITLKAMHQVYITQFVIDELVKIGYPRILVDRKVIVSIILELSEKDELKKSTVIEENPFLIFRRIEQFKLLNTILSSLDELQITCALLKNSELEEFIQNMLEVDEINNKIIYWNNDNFCYQYPYFRHSPPSTYRYRIVSRKTYFYKEFLRLTKKILLREKKLFK